MRAALLLFVGLLTVAAFNTFPKLRLFRTELPGEDHESYAWVDPAPSPTGTHSCANCHAEIYREWTASGHARAARNRRFLNLYGGSDWHGRPNVSWSLLGQHPEGSSVCTACHAPSLSLAGPAYEDLRQIRGVPAQGVHCDYCHKVIEATADPRGLTHGRFGLKLLRPSVGQLFFGPLEDVDRPEDAYSPVYRESRYCASCHEGTVFGVPVYTTYTEWLASPARREGKTCQSCHMLPTGTMTNMAPGKGGVERDPWTLSSHSFPGGREDMLHRCLSVKVQLVPESGDFRASVEVYCRNVGHRVPTGFIDRNVLLVVEPLNEHGQPLKFAGPALGPLAGSAWEGRPGRLFAKQLTDGDARHPVPFWKPGGDVIDSRLRPGESDCSLYRFPAELDRIRVRLLYRRFWQEVADAKQWPDNELVLIDHVLPASRSQPVSWTSP